MATRTDEWYQDQGGMISTALVHVNEETDTVTCAVTVFEELLKAAGWSREVPGAAAPAAQE